MSIYAGIIGFGYMGNYHLQKSMVIDGLEIIAAYDINPERLADAKEKGLGQNVKSSATLRRKCFQWG